MTVPDSAQFNQLVDTILSRRTSKHFDGGEVSRDTLRKLLELAVWAPNHRLNQPWLFRVVRGEGIARWIQTFKEKLPVDEVPHFQKNFDRLAKVPAVIFVSCLRDEHEIIDDENYAATCAAVQNILLGATALGLQSYWNTGRMMFHPISLEFLAATPQERMVGALWIGKGEIPEPKARIPSSEKTFWIEGGS